MSVSTTLTSHANDTAPTAVARALEGRRRPSDEATTTRQGSRRLVPALLALLAVYVPSYLVYFGSGAPFSLAHAAATCGGRPVLDTRWSYTAAQAHEYLVACGPAGRAAVMHQQLADVVYVALYAGVLLVAYAFLLRVGRLTGRGWRLLLALPLVTAALDYLENAGIWSLLAGYPHTGRLADSLSVVTATKLALGYVSLAAFAVLAVAAIGHRLRLRRGLVPQELS